MSIAGRSNSSPERSEGIYYFAQDESPSGAHLLGSMGQTRGISSYMEYKGCNPSSTRHLGSRREQVSWLAWGATPAAFKTRLLHMHV